MGLLSRDVAFDPRGRSAFWRAGPTFVPLSRQRLFCARSTSARGWPARGHGRHDLAPRHGQAVHRRCRGRAARPRLAERRSRRAVSSELEMSSVPPPIGAALLRAPRYSNRRRSSCPRDYHSARIVGGSFGGMGGCFCGCRICAPPAAGRTSSESIHDKVSSRRAARARRVGAGVSARARATSFSIRPPPPHGR